MRRVILTFSLAFTVSAAQALQPLHENPTVVNGFYTIGLADEIRKNCDSIDARMVRAVSYLRALHRYAKDLGYSDAEIEELTDNSQEKEKLRAKIRVDLAARGASPKTPEGYCTVGHDEIARGSAAGRLLKVN